VIVSTRAAAKRFCGGAFVCGLFGLLAGSAAFPAFAQQRIPPVKANTRLGRQVPPPVAPTTTPVTPAGQTPPATPAAAPSGTVVIPATPPAAATMPNALPTPIDVPPPVAKAPYLPFPTLPPVPLDENNAGVGIGQQLSRSRGAQGRMLWIDATANIDRYNTADKIRTLCAKIKSVGFNTIVLDVKPIIGYTLYPSRYAPKLTTWVKPGVTRNLPANFDPLREMVTQAHAQGLTFIANFNAFSEGHRDFLKGPGYDHPEWQTVYYEVQTRVRRDFMGGASHPVMDRPNLAPRTPDDLALYTDLSKVRANGDTLISLLDANGFVAAQMTAQALATVQPTLPKGGAALVGFTGNAINFLRTNALPGYRMVLDTAPIYIPISQRPERQVPLMTNPNSPEVRQRILDMLGEVATNYPIDGVIFDDRLRYAALNADFSETTRRQFEQYLGAGKPLTWPDDVLRYEVAWPSLERKAVPGPYYDAWLVFRALTLRNWFADAVRTVKTIRPQASVSTYVGSWYPDYPDLGANWAADDLQAGFRFLNESYKKTGWAGLTDFVVTGCYYPTATIFEAAQKGIDIGQTVEAAGQFSNRAVNDQTWVYAGIALDQFKNKPDALKRVLQAAAGTTQGIMCFDLSHDIDPLWPIFADAFRTPAQSPHQVPGLTAELRTQHAAQKASGVSLPPVILYRGTSGTGF
jgi:uncharacterized lipoprotein YddW (UPF0748 family)